MINAKQIHVDNASPFLDGVLPRSVIGSGNTGIRHKDVDIVMPIDHGFNRAIYESNLRNIDDLSRDAAGLFSCWSDLSRTALLWSQIETDAPDCRSRIVTERPIPWAPPVTTAQRPFKSIWFTLPSR
jgi:hypothetical protein